MSKNSTTVSFVIQSVSINVCSCHTELMRVTLEIGSPLRRTRFYMQMYDSLPVKAWAERGVGKPDLPRLLEVKQMHRPLEKQALCRKVLVDVVTPL